MGKKNNILFYFSDQQRADTLGCYGQELPISPIADELAEEGTRFENAFTAQPVCGPCRAIFQTGQYPTTTGCFRNNKMLPLNSDTIAREMEKAGYENAYVGKWHLASEGELEQIPYIDNRLTSVPLEYRGGYNGFWRASDTLEFTSNSRHGYIFDEAGNKITFNGYRTDFITDQALEFLENYDGNKPFFLTVSHIEPHHQNDAGHYEGPEGSKEKYRNFKIPGDLAAFPYGDWAEEYPDYLGACNAIDRNLGRIVRKLKDKGLYEDTIIIFTSDHGSHFRTRNHDINFCGYDDYKRTAHDGAIKVPLIITGGAFKGRGTIDCIVSTASIPKTIMSIAGVNDIDRFIGENLEDIAKGDIPNNRLNEAFIQISESRVGRALRTKDFMYAVTAPGINGGAAKDSNLYVDDMLYDLRKDPYELENQVGNPNYADIKLELRKKLLSWIIKEENKEPSITDNNNEKA